MFLASRVPRGSFPVGNDPSHGLNEEGVSRYTIQLYLGSHWLIAKDNLKSKVRLNVRPNVAENEPPLESNTFTL